MLHSPGEIVFTSLDDWERDYDFFCQLRKVRKIVWYIYFRGNTIGHWTLVARPIMVAESVISSGGI